MELELILQEKFGHPQFRPGQREIIDSVLSGRNVLAILPTGAGKTLCYQLPAKLKDGMTIVVSPLLSLMEDQVHQLRAAGDKTVRQLNGMLTFEEKQQVLRELTNNTMLFLSPEMLTNKFVMRKLQSMKVCLFVVDEAHCISQWGHEFRTDYLRLSEIRKALGNPPCLALTATATNKVEEDILQQLDMKEPAVHRHSINREHIKFLIKEADSLNDKMEKFQECVQNLGTPAIIYTATRKEAVKLSGVIKSLGIGESAYYHGGMSKEDRLLVQHQFINDELSFVCATNAFGMGINKSNIRTVIHMHLPLSAEQYVQEAGRAGRDEKESAAVLIYTKEDRFTPLSFIYNEFPREQELKVWFQLMQQRNNNFSLIKGEDIKGMFQIDETHWRMLMFYLEKAKALSGDNIISEKITNDLLEKLTNHFQRRRSEKEMKFFEFVKVLTNDRCIRNNLLRYFDENKSVSLTKCCSSCGLTISSIAIHEEKVNHITHKPQLTWKESLYEMLIPSKRGPKL